MSERNGKKQIRTLGQQKKGELKKGKGTGKGSKRKKLKKNKSPPRWVRDCNLGSYKWMASKQASWVVRWGAGGKGGCWVTPALLQALFTFFHSEATLYFFLSFFLQKALAALQEAVVLVGKKNPIRYS
jgi:hypothetical protein